MWKSTLFYGLKEKMTKEQEAFVNAMLDPTIKVVAVDSVAGSGKTTLAVAAAHFLQKELIWCFSPTEENTYGFTPGTVEQKEAKYLAPLYDALLEIGQDPQRVIYSEDNVENIKRGNCFVQVKSHVFMRGMNIKNKFLIIDESQNLTASELKKVLTRVHDDTKVVLVGSTRQFDIPEEHSGFTHTIEHFSEKDWFKECKLTKCFRGEIAAHADLL